MLPCLVLRLRPCFGIPALSLYSPSLARCGIRALFSALRLLPLSAVRGLCPAVLPAVLPAVVIPAALHPAVVLVLASALLAALLPKTHRAKMIFDLKNLPYRSRIVIVALQAVLLGTSSTRRLIRHIHYFKRSGNYGRSWRRKWRRWRWQY